MLRIELLNQKGEKVVYEQGFVSGRKVREALALQDEMDKNENLSEAERLDKMVTFVADVFNDEKVIDGSIYDGTEDARKLMRTIEGIMDIVMGNKEDGLLKECGTKGTGVTAAEALSNLKKMYRNLMERPDGRFVISTKQIITPFRCAIGRRACDDGGRIFQYDYVRKEGETWHEACCH
ncbi:hypothetical protein O2313_05830 [Bacillus amyloliquefaciens]|uniref:phage tail assembly chaperone G n=1 Tax=Bacillus amyloliquefaciens TaxID=1390 RepID=UPI0022B036DF|nr:hypothetical protein [Bacillus amyloliquefaciens]MCZ4247053.1 hypothetical protein [Bacillus amyloliquefaciens]